MTEQVSPATGAHAVAASMSTGAESAPFVSQVPGTPVRFGHYNGKAVSWVAVTIILAAFLAGGLALVFGPTWWLFWASLGVATLGTLLALGTGIFDDWY